MESERSSAYLKLSQFLDLESKWLDAPDKGELCHRICRTVVILLDTPAVAIGVSERGGPYRVLASEGDWSESPDHAAATTAQLLRKACDNETAQLKSLGDKSVGVFPFTVDENLRGCLHVKIDRPIFQGAEVSFMRFLASLTAIMLAGGVPDGPPASASAQGAEERDEGAARRYVAMAVHDLRNPLNVVSGYASLLVDGSLGELRGEQREAVEAINRQVGVLLSVVDQLIDLSRMEGFDTELSPTSFEVRALFDDLRETCFPDRNGQILWPGPESAFEFRTDRRRVFSIVQNLVDNAVKHAGTGPVTVECTRERKQLVLQVSDRGPGLDAGQRAGLTSRDAAAGSQAPATGLGLYAVASSARVLGARVDVNDRDGGGTTIEVRIPPS